MFTPLFWAAPIIGSAVGAAVNGGTFKSFLIGAAIVMAAGMIAGAMGFSPPDIGTGFALTTENIIQATVAGALTGAVSGAISSAVYGGNWGKNIGQGAMGGAIGAGVAMATAAAVGKLKVWVHGMRATEELSFQSGTIADPKDIAINPFTLEKYDFERLEEGLAEMRKVLEPYKADPNGIEYYAWMDADYNIYGPYKGLFREVPSNIALSNRPNNAILFGHTHGAASPQYDTENLSGYITAMQGNKRYSYGDLGASSEVVPMRWIETLSVSPKTGQGFKVELFSGIVSRKTLKGPRNNDTEKTTVFGGIQGPGGAGGVAGGQDAGAAGQ